MKTVLSLLIICLINVTTFGQDNYKPLGSYEKGNELYTNGEYEKAISEYELILSQKKESPEVYFNLGCAWYKNGNLPKAILNFERAKKMAPNDKDVSFNLELAYSKTVDDITAVPLLFIVNWWQGLFRLLSVDNWAVLSIILLIIGLILLILYFVSDQINIRKFDYPVLYLLIETLHGH